jgi:hypothetical protein
MKKITELEQRLSEPDSDKFNELESKIEELEEELGDNDERLLRAGENIKAMDQIRKLTRQYKQAGMSRSERSEGEFGTGCEGEAAAGGGPVSDDRDNPRDERQGEAARRKAR